MFLAVEFSRMYSLARTILLFISLAMLKSVAFAEFKPISQFNSQTELEGAKDPLSFFRSNVALYYKVALQNKEQLPIINRLLEINGLCMGDAHLENFGFLFQTAKVSIFAPNDVDDFDRCPLVMDLMRLLVSVELADQSMGFKKITDAYLLGLTGGRFEPGPFIRSLHTRSFQQADAVNERLIRADRFIRRKGLVDLDARELQDVSDIVSDLNQKITGGRIHILLDVVKTKKTSGGSAGLSRYHLLLSRGKRLIHLELKEMVDSATSVVFGSAYKSNADRIKAAIDVTLGKVRSPYYGVYQVGRSTFLMRPKFRGNVGVEFQIRQKKVNKSTIQYEAYSLGRLHALSLRKTTNYSSVLKSTTKEAWKLEASTLARYFIEHYRKESDSRSHINSSNN